MELHVFKIGQTNPQPFARYDPENLSDSDRRERIFAYYRKRRDQFHCKIIELGKVTTL